MLLNDSNYRTQQNFKTQSRAINYEELTMDQRVDVAGDIYSKVEIAQP